MSWHYSSHRDYWTWDNTKGTTKEQQQYQRSWQRVTDFLQLAAQLERTPDGSSCESLTSFSGTLEQILHTWNCLGLWPVSTWSYHTPRLPTVLEVRRLQSTKLITIKWQMEAWACLEWAGPWGATSRPPTSALAAVVYNTEVTDCVDQSGGWQCLLQILLCVTARLNRNIST